MDYLLAFKSFFGKNPDHIGKSVIVTNISPIYLGFLSNADRAYTNSGGFYENSEIVLCEGKLYHVVKVAPGSCIVDVLKLLTAYVEEIIFVGIAGCISSDYKVGDVCIPTKFVSPEYVNTEGGIVICQTSGLVQTDAYYYDLQSRGVKLVDTECYDVYQICRERAVKLKYIVQISDLPLTLPFYAAPSQPIRMDRFLKLINDERYVF